MAISRLYQKTESDIDGLHRGYGLIFLVLNLMIAGVFWWQLPPNIPLFYGMPYGTAQLAHKGWFLLLPGIAVTTYGVGMFLMKLKLKSKLFAPMIGWLQTLCLFLIMLAMIHIVMVVL